MPFLWCAARELNPVRMGWKPSMPPQTPATRCLVQGDLESIPSALVCKRPLPCKEWLCTQRPKHGGSCGNRTRLNLLDRELPTQSVYEPQNLAGILGLEPSAVRLTGGRHHLDGPMPIKVAGGFLAGRCLEG